MFRVLTVLIALLASVDAFRSVCYYTNTAQYRSGKAQFFPENINQSLCTHIIYAFAIPEGLNIRPFEWNDVPTEGDPGMYSKVLKLKRNDPTLKVLLAVGGYNMGSGPFVDLVQTPNSRTTFARNVVKYLRRFAFDGFDMGWQYPAARGSTPEDKPKFQLLMEELMKKFRDEAYITQNPRLLLTVAVPAVKTYIDNGYLVADLSRTVDFISIMSFDFHFAWEKNVGFNSPLYAHPSETGNATQLNLDWAARYYVSLGVPKDKLNIGIATYGRSFKLKNPSRHSILSPATGKGNPGTYTKEAGVLAFYEICDMAQGALIVQEHSQKNPYLVKDNQWVGYDDVASVTAKACYALSNGFGGILFWTMDFDDFLGTSCNQGKYPLISAAYNTVKYPSAAKCDTPIAIPSATTSPPESEVPDSVKEAFRCVCYFTNLGQYRRDKGQFYPEDIDGSLCTHIIYAFAKPEGLNIKPTEFNDEPTEWAPAMYSRVLKLKRNYPKLKVLLAVGGYNMGSGPFIPLVQTPYSRTTFANNVVTYLRKWGFDGFEMDWEYPASRGSPPGDKPKFQRLMEELMQRFRDEASLTNKPRLLLTVAVPAGKTDIDKGYYVANLSRTVDFISIMTYDFHGVWDNFVGFNSPLFAHPNETGSARQLNVDWAARYYVSLGARKDKLNIGIATYGRSFTLQDPSRHSILSPAVGKGNPGPYTRESGILAFYEICAMAVQGGQIVQVPSQKNPYMVKDNQWVGYDDVDSVIAKACYAMTNGLGGIFFWTLDCDDFLGTSCNQGKYPLVTQAYTAVKSPSAAKCRRALERMESKSRGCNLVANKGCLWLFVLLCILMKACKWQSWISAALHFLICVTIWLMILKIIARVDEQWHMLMKSIQRILKKIIPEIKQDAKKK